MTEAAQAQATSQATSQARSGAELERQLDADVRSALEAAQREMAQQAMAQRAMAQAGQQAPPPPPPPLPEGRTFRIEEGGRVVQIGPEGVKVLPGETTQPATEATPDIPREAVVISIAFFIMVAVILIGWPIARALARRMDRATVAPPRVAAGDQERLVRIEQAVEAMAVEVERISENQRFVTKLLAEGRGAPEALPVRGAAESAAQAAAVERDRP